MRTAIVLVFFWSIFASVPALCEDRSFVLGAYPTPRQLVRCIRSLISVVGLPPFPVFPGARMRTVDDLLFRHKSLAVIVDRPFSLQQAKVPLTSLGCWGTITIAESTRRWTRAKYVAVPARLDEFQSYVKKALETIVDPLQAQDFYLNVYGSYAGAYSSLDYAGIEEKKYALVNELLIAENVEDFLIVLATARPEEAARLVANYFQRLERHGFAPPQPFAARLKAIPVVGR